DHRQPFRPIIQTSASRFLSLLVGTGPPGGPPSQRLFLYHSFEKDFANHTCLSGSGTEKVTRHPTGYEQTKLKRRNSYVLKTYHDRSYRIVLHTGGVGPCPRAPGASEENHGASKARRGKKGQHG